MSETALSASTPGLIGLLPPEPRPSSSRPTASEFARWAVDAYGGQVGGCLADVERLLARMYLLLAEHYKRTSVNHSATDPADAIRSLRTMLGISLAGSGRGTRNADGQRAVLLSLARLVLLQLAEHSVAQQFTLDGQLILAQEWNRRSSELTACLNKFALLEEQACIDQTLRSMNLIIEPSLEWVDEQGHALAEISSGELLDEPPAAARDLVTRWHAIDLELIAIEKILRVDRPQHGAGSDDPGHPGLVCPRPRDAFQEGVSDFAHTQPSAQEATGLWERGFRG